MKGNRAYKIAGMNEHFIRLSLRAFLDCMEQNGVQDIELWAGLPHLYAPDAGAEKIREVRTQIAERGLRLICYTPEQCVYPFNMAAKEPALQKLTRAYYRRNIEIAAELGAPMFQIVAGVGYRNEPVEDARKRSLDAIADVTGYAAAFGLRVVLEALEPNESNVLTTASDIKWVLDTLQLDTLGAIVDTCPMAAAGETIDDCYQILGDRLWHFHFIDRDHLVWGDGDLPLQEYLASLQAHGYAGHLTIEILNERYVRQPAAAFERALSAVRNAGQGW